MVIMNYMKSIIAQIGKGSDQRSNETLMRHMLQLFQIRCYMLYPTTCASGVPNPLNRWNCASPILAT